MSEPKCRILQSEIELMNIESDKLALKAEKHNFDYLRASFSKIPAGCDS